MAFETASTHLIFFITAVVIATSVASMFNESVGVMSGAIYENQNAVVERLGTDIEIINDPGNVPNTPLIIYAKNIGSEILDQNRTTLIVDGYVLSASDYNTSIMESTTFWETQTVLNYTLLVASDYYTLAAGDHYVKIQINGVSDRLTFRI